MGRRHAVILSASYKTDIPAFYGAWFTERLRAGWAEVVNPYNGRPFRVAMDRGTVDGIVFWTRNLEPFERHLPEVRDRGYPFIVQYTVLGYPRALDLSVVAPERSVAALERLAARYGPRAGVWRYDPIVFTSLTPPAWHVETFGRLSESLRGTVDEVVVSFAQIYRKSARNLAAAARAFAFTWDDPADGEKTALLRDLAAIARANGQRLTLCAQPHLLVEGVEESACIDAARLSDMAGRPVAAARRPHRKTCGCFQSKDIGAYDTCPHGCAYCYAVQHRTRAKAAYHGQDVFSPRLGP